MSLRAGIVGYGFYVPEKVLTNRDFEKMVDTSDEWIRTRTGIAERRIAPPEMGVSELATRAALKAMESAKVKPEEIDLIICGTSTSDTLLPATACWVQKNIGAKNALAFDITAACAGFVFSAVTAEQFIVNGTAKTALVIGAEKLSTYVDWKDRATCVLFGDGAGAVILKPTNHGGFLSSVIGSDGNHAELITIPLGTKYPPTAESVKANAHVIHMAGSEVFKLAVRGMADATDKALKKAGLTVTDVACFVPHQANLRIIDAAAERLGVPKERIFVNLQKYGNTSAASCLIALCEALGEGRIKKGDKIVFATFGSGLVWGSLVAEWILP